MKQTPFTFDDNEYVLSFTAEALFTVYEKYGQTADILGETHCMENTLEGWKAACWLGALLAAQGELQRRLLGHDPRPMLTAEQLRRGASPADMLSLRTAIRDAMEAGFRRDNQPDEEAEVDAVLAERAAAQKKNESPGRFRAQWLAAGACVLGLSLREILLLTPGTFWDMLEAARPRRDEKTDQWKDGDD